MGYGYRCPRCRSTNALHGEDCRYAHLADGAIEKAHIDIVASLSTSRHTEDELERQVPDGWSHVHDDVLDLYRSEGRITTEQRETDDGTVDVLYLRTPDEYRDQLVPTERYIETVWQHGPVDGAKDVSVTAAISWHEWRDFSWSETKERVADWLRNTGAWERGSWEESTIDELLRSKKHVFDGSYGWKEAAKAAKRTIESAHGGASA